MSIEHVYLVIKGAKRDDKNISGVYTNTRTTPISYRMMSATYINHIELCVRTRYCMVVACYAMAQYNESFRTQFQRRFVAVSA